MCYRYIEDRHVLNPLSPFFLVPTPAIGSEHKVMPQNQGEGPTSSPIEDRQATLKKASNSCSHGRKIDYVESFLLYYYTTGLAFLAISGGIESPYADIRGVK